MLLIYLCLILLDFYSYLPLHHHHTPAHYQGCSEYSHSSKDKFKSIPQGFFLPLIKLKTLITTYPSPRKSLFKLNKVCYTQTLIYLKGKLRITVFIRLTPYHPQVVNDVRLTYINSKLNKLLPFAFNYISPLSQRSWSLL